MPVFEPTDREACKRLVELALDEDLDQDGDLTSIALIPEEAGGRGIFRTRQPGTVAGLPAAELVYGAFDPHLDFRALKADGSAVSPGERLAEIVGPLRAILAGERIALNFLMRLSGIATQTRQYVDAVQSYRTQILDTRKTMPGWRLLEKYAVRCGGGTNHRMGLYDAVLIKDNHLAALGGGAPAVEAAVREVRQRFGTSVPVTVEVDNLEQLEAALGSGPDVVLLDNMSVETMRNAAARRDALAPAILLEASGGVDLGQVAKIAEAGVDRISVGKLTHSAPALDIGLDYETV